MKQRNKRTHVRVDSGQVRTFLPIALWTTKSKVVQVVVLPMLGSSDVVYVKRDLITRLRNTAIFTAILGSLDDPGAKR